jgi:phosphatidylglycerol:prolipoprotein diacylglycerol transferase
LLITPLLFFVLCYIIGTNPLKQIDSITLAPALIVALLKVSCFCAGCCPGLPTPYGLFNYDTERREFPIQLIEGFVYFLVFILVLYLQKKIKREGLLYPIFISSYSLAKFVLQFFRSDEKLISIFNIHHFLSIFAFLIGIIWLVLVYKYGERIIRKFNREIKIKNIEFQLNNYNNKLNKKSKKTLTAMLMS